MRHCSSLLIVLTLILLVGISACADLVNVGGKLHYYTADGREAEKIGLDVSFYNNQIDFKALADQGFDFVIIRLGGRGWGTGRLYNDSKTQSNLITAKEAGLEVGAYFYSTAVNVTEAAEEAAYAIRILNGTALELPIFIDMEYSGDYPNGRADTLTPGERADIISVFCQTIEAAGYESGLYASEGFARFDLDYQAVSLLPFWMASYTIENQLPGYIASYDIWQQTDSAYAGGIDGPFDLNLVIP